MLPGRKKQQERERKRGCVFLPLLLTLAKKWDGTVLLNQMKESYYKGHWEKREKRVFLKWKGLFVALLKGQRTDSSINHDEQHSCSLYEP